MISVYLLPSSRLLYSSLLFISYLYNIEGSGKTYTSFGPENSLDDEISLDDDLPESSGLIVRSCRELLKAKDILLKSGVYLSLSAQFVEIYDEKVRIEVPDKIFIFS